MELSDLLGNPKAYIETFLSVRTKQQSIVPFRLKPAQHQFLDQLAPRTIVLKARQMGITTAALAILYVRTITSVATTTLLVAHKKAQAKEFLETIKMFYELTPPQARPVVERSNLYEFSFPDLRSKILVDSPTKDLGRGLTVNNALASEMSSWLFPEESMTSLEESVPTDSGMIIVEATPKGAGNHFHGMWTGAQDVGSPTWNGYTPILLPASLEYDAAWLEEKRRKIGARRFAQEYGLDFQQSGLPVFEDVHLKRHAARIDAGLVGPRDPEPGHQYLHGVDVAEGGAKGDFDVIVVLDRATGAEVHRVRGRWPIDVFAKRVDEVARKYPGLVGVERNNHGHSLLLRLRQLDTPGLYRGDDGKDGWLTTKPSKKLMIDELEEAVRNDYVQLGSLHAIEEFRDYQHLEPSGTGAPRGHYDDEVMGTAIAWQVRKRNSTPVFLTD